MALISPATLLAPFLNKVHLGTIVFIVALFAVFRFAGGSVSIESEHRSSRDEPILEEVEEPTKNEVVESPAKPVTNDSIYLDPSKELQKLGIPVRRSEIEDIPTTDNSSDDLVGGMVDSPSDERGAKTSDSGDLDDIERRLGLK